jgi:ABC-type Mn2+/Zn2+ transport system permease subunit
VGERERLSGRLRLVTAVAARAVQDDVVVVDGEAESARDVLDRVLEGWVLERRDASAVVADEVMVVVAVGLVALVARDALPDVDALHEPQLRQQLEDPVDARASDAAALRAQAVVDLLRGQRARLLFEQLNDGVAGAAAAMACRCQRRERVLAPGVVRGAHHRLDRIAHHANQTHSHLCLACVFEPFQLPFVQRALVELLLLAVLAGTLGCWIVLRGLAFPAHGAAAAAFPGLVLADGLGFAAALGGFGAALLFALTVGGLDAAAGDRRAAAGREGHDARTALVLVAALAAGVVLASDVFHSAASVESLLFGSLLAIDPADVRLAAAAALTALLASALLGTRWLAVGFDPAAARALGVRSRLPDALLLALVAFGAVATLSAVGVLLATALLVVPAATTRLVSDRIPRWQLATTALAAAEGTIGVWLAVQLNAPPGATIAVVAGAVFALVALRETM